MKTYITNIRARGIKNLKNEISLSFYDETKKPSINLTNTNIKVIYGANGSGKSAILHIMELYRKIISKNNFLYSEEGTVELSELLNKESNDFEINVSFLAYENDKIIGRFRHELLLGKANGEFKIKSEKLVVIKTRSEEIFVEINNGTFLVKNISDALIGRSINQLSTRSIVNIFSEIHFSDDTQLHKADSQIFPFLLLGHSIAVKNIDSSSHNFYINYKTIENNKQPEKMADQILLSSRYFFKVPNNKTESFKEFISRLEYFMKLFKSDLESIELDLKYSRNITIAEPYFNYGKFKIHLEFESDGIKKLVDLFSLLRLKENGCIVFIDDLDSNINDVYLIKMLEYFVDNPIGQLVFTSHSVSPMKVLAKSKHAIDFIRKDGQIVEWKKDGNYSPEKAYQNGLVRGLPFNVDSFDFIGMFDELI